MWEVLWAVVTGCAGLLAGYGVGRRHEREAQRERAYRGALTERDESSRTPGQPTNRSELPSTVKVAKWRGVRMSDEEVQR